MIYDDKTVTYFRKSKQHSFTSRVNNLNYNLAGERISVSLPDSILIYNALDSCLLSKLDIENKKSEFFTENTVLSSSKNVINYISFYDSSILRKFIHSDVVRDFSVGDNDLFLTISNSVTIFDIKSPSPLFKIPIQNAVGTFIDDNNIVIGNKSIIRYYDIRNYKGPFKTKCITDIDCIKYNRYARKIVMQNKTDSTIIISDSNGKDTKINVEGTGDLTSDGKYYFALHEDKVKMYNVENNVRVFFMRETELVNGCIAVNPAYNQFVTGRNNIRFWLPEV